VFDLPYIAKHPLLAAIYRRHAELVDQVQLLPTGSRERKSVERRISQLEQYRLPKPHPSEQKVTPLTNQLGQIIGQSGSLRRRSSVTHPGRPEECRVKTRAAFEDKLAHPQLTWRELSEKYGFKNSKDLERQVRLLKVFLNSEGIPIPPSTAYHEAKEAFDRGLRTLAGHPPE
jgi:hypothetical protein